MSAELGKVSFNLFYIWVDIYIYEMIHILNCGLMYDHRSYEGI